MASHAWWQSAADTQVHAGLNEAGRSVVSGLDCLEKIDAPVIRYLSQHTGVSWDREIHGLVSQLRRAAVSVPSNVAEGQARLSTGEFRHFLGNARGSLMEVETQILIAPELDYLRPGESEALLGAAAEVGRILN